MKSKYENSKYKLKYLKYKNKYLSLKKQLGWNNNIKLLSEMFPLLDENIIKSINEILL
jgi:hypothetical protein